jgi:hypothetical protein
MKRGVVMELIKTFGDIEVGNKIGVTLGIKVKEITWIESISNHTARLYYDGGSLLIGLEEEKVFIYQVGTFYADYEWFKENIIKKEIERLEELL